jgi:hypothetical protein
MPAFSFPIGSIVRAVTYCSVPGQVSTNTHKFQLTSLTGAGAFNSVDFLASYDSALSLLYLPLLANGATYHGTQLYLMNPIGAAPRPDDITTNTAVGTGGASLMPTQASGLISFYTSLLGKTGQGRSYIPFPSATSNDTNGTPTAAYITDLDSLAFSLRAPQVIVAGGVSGTFELVVYKGGAAIPQFVIDTTQRDAWATQRRRGAFGKANKLPF